MDTEKHLLAENLSWTLLHCLKNVTFTVLQVHRLHLCAAELLTATLTDSQVASQTCASSHSWTSSAERHISIQDQVRHVWEQQFGVSSASAGHRSVAALLQELKSAESPTPTTNVPLKQVRVLQLLFWILHSRQSDLDP